MIASYSWLNSFFKKPLPKPEKLAEFLTLHSFENESIVDIKNDWIFSLDVLPDRAGDCLSHLGIARECSAILGLTLINPEIKIKESLTKKIKSFLEVETKDKDCRRYLSRVVLAVKIEPSPKWIQEKLIACGLNPINNVVDATNFVMLELGQPLHVFDYDKLETKKIIIRKAKPNEKISLLTGTEIVLDKTMLLIADEKEALAIAGIKGGKKAEITKETKNIVIESANFTPKLISQTARKLNLRTDASIRFEQNLDPNLADIAIDRVVTLISQITKGDVVKGKIDIYPVKTTSIKIRLDIDLLDRILGVQISQKELEQIINRLGFTLLQINKKFINVEIPTWRQDIVIRENLIEEIGRIYGYEKIAPLLPCNEIAPAKTNEELFWQNRARDVLRNIGWTEVYNYSFLGDEEKDMFSLDLIEIKNPVSVFFKYIRSTLVPHLLKNTKENLKNFKEIKIYEISKVFYKEEKKLKEERRLSGVIYISDENKQQQFLKLKGHLEYLLRELGIKTIDYQKVTNSNIWNNDNSLILVCNEKKVGIFGQIEDGLSEKLGISEKIMIFDFNFDELQKSCSREREYKKISYHPAANRDMSGIVDENVIDKDLLGVINQIPKIDQLIDTEVKILDVYRKGLPEGKKSLTIRVTLQHNEKTLNSEEIDINIKNITKCLSDKFGWEERK